MRRDLPMKIINFGVPSTKLKISADLLPIRSMKRQKSSRFLRRSQKRKILSKLVEINAIYLEDKND